MKLFCLRISNIIMIKEKNIKYFVFHRNISLLIIFSKFSFSPFFLRLDNCKIIHEIFHFFLEDLWEGRIERLGRVLETIR